MRSGVRLPLPGWVNLRFVYRESMIDFGDAPSLRDLYPNATDEQLAEAEANLIADVQLALRMYERIRNDPKSYQQFKALTAQMQNGSFEAPQKGPPQE